MEEEELIYIRLPNEKYAWEDAIANAEKHLELDIKEKNKNK